MSNTPFRTRLLVGAAASAVAVGAAALPNVTPVFATSLPAPCPMPTPAGPAHYALDANQQHVLVSGKLADGELLHVASCKDSGEPFQKHDVYRLVQAPRSNRFLLQLESQSTTARGGSTLAINVDHAVIKTERQFDRARRAIERRVRLNVAGLKGSVYTERGSVTQLAATKAGGKPLTAERKAEIASDFASQSRATSRCTTPTPPIGDPAPQELARRDTLTGTLTLLGSPGQTYRTLGCRNDGAEVAGHEYVLFQAPKSKRWLAFTTSTSYGNRVVSADAAVPGTERQFNQAVRDLDDAHKLRLPGVKGTVYAGDAQTAALTLVATKVDGKRPSRADRDAAADEVLSAGDPFLQQ